MIPIRWTLRAGWAGRRARHREHGEDEAAVECASIHYWITSSARSSSNCGIVMPSAFAVFRLITSSNLVGCSTGRSAGLAPFNILRHLLLLLRGVGERRGKKRARNSAHKRPPAHHCITSSACNSSDSWIVRNGSWRVIIRLLAIRKNKAERGTRCPVARLAPASVGPAGRTTRV